MNITLLKLVIENFKGLPRFVFEPDGNNAVLIAANGVGKTRIADAFYWLLRGKNSEGATDFSARPLDENNNIISGLIVKVEGKLMFNTEIHVLRKEEHEKIVKKTGQITGYETKCWIDEVPLKVGDYKAWIEDRLPEETCKLLTDLYHFNRDVPAWNWMHRRSMLLELANGQIETPKGFDDLLKAANGREIKDYKKVLQDQKKRLEEERDAIGPALNENHRTLETLGGGEVDTGKLSAERDDIYKQIELLDNQRDDVYAQEKKRNETIERIQRLEAQLTRRQTILETDMSNVSALIEEKTILQKQLAENWELVAKAEESTRKKQHEIDSHQRSMDSHLKALEEIRAEHKKTIECKAETVCYVCGQALPASKITEAAEAKQKQLEELRRLGNQKKQLAVEEKKILEELTAELNASKERQEKIIAEHQQLETSTKEKIATLEKRIENREKPKPENDFECQKVTGLIQKEKSGLGPSIQEQIKVLEEKREQLQTHSSSISDALRNVDTAKKIQDRITELQENQKKLSQQIADVDKRLAEIGEYTAAESRLIENSVNSKFRHVRFKLFEVYQNGNIDETCVATLNGVPYRDMSSGERILVGIDIINALSRHYAISVVLFIDNAETLTLPNEAVSQCIELRAARGQKELKVEVEQVEAKAVA